MEEKNIIIEEINSLNLEIKKNEDEIAKFKKDLERVNKKIALKQLELNNIQFNKIEVEEPKTEENINNNEN